MLVIPTVSERIIFADKDVGVLDRNRIGISYSGGGPLVVIELGIAQAFIQKGIIPAVIAGASAGGIAGAAHALDPHHGAGIEMARDMLLKISDHRLGLGKLQILDRVLQQRTHLVSLGDNAPLRQLIRDGLAAMHLGEVTIGDFEAPGRSSLMVLATNRLNGESVVFPSSTPIEDALVATSAIPGVFPWQDMTVDGQPMTLVDGGIVTNQPISRLVEAGCGDIYVCAVGYAGGLVPPPTNAFDNAMQSVYLMAHQCTKLEEQFMKAKVGGAGRIHDHIHPEISLPEGSFDFLGNPALVHEVMEEAKSQTLSWLETH